MSTTKQSLGSIGLTGDIVITVKDLYASIKVNVTPFGKTTSVYTISTSGVILV